jgi:hypothetical protein
MIGSSREQPVTAARGLDLFAATALLLAQTQIEGHNHLVVIWSAIEYADFKEDLGSNGK